MKTSLWLVCILIITIAIVFSNSQKFSERRRRSKEIEDRIDKLDDATKARIHAMKASGMPHEAIAEKVAYETGGKNMAKRIVDAMSSDGSDYTKKQKTDKVKESMKKKIDKAVKAEKSKAERAKATANDKARTTQPATVNVKAAKTATASNNIKTGRK